MFDEEISDLTRAEIYELIKELVDELELRDMAEAGEPDLSELPF